MSLDALPREILELIVSHVRPCVRTICALNATSRAMRAALHANRETWRDGGMLRIRDEAVQKPAPAACPGFGGLAFGGPLRVLRESPWMHGRVRDLSVRIDSGVGPDELEAAARLCPEIRSLTVRVSVVVALHGPVCLAGALNALCALERLNVVGLGAWPTKASLPRLTFLSMAIFVTALDGLAESCPRLQTLLLSYSPSPSNLDGLARCRELRCLELASIHCAVPVLPRLVRLKLNDVPVLPPLDLFANLEHLELRLCSNLARLPPLPPRLRSLCISRCGHLVDLTASSGGACLETVAIADCCRLRDLGPLGALPCLGALTLLRLEGGIDVSGLARCAALRVVTFSAVHLEAGTLAKLQTLRPDVAVTATFAVNF